MRPPDTQCRSFSPHKTLALLALVMVGAFFLSGCAAQQVADDAKRLQTQVAQLEAQFPELGERIAAIEAERDEAERELRYAMRAQDWFAVDAASARLTNIAREVADAKLIYPELAQQIRDAHAQSTTVAIGTQSVADQANIASGLFGKAAGAIGIDTGGGFPLGETIGGSALGAAGIGLAWWLRNRRIAAALPPPAQFDHHPPPPPAHHPPPARGYSATAGAHAMASGYGNGNGTSGAYTVPHSGAEAKT